jgi:hypothetical protein
LQRIVLTFVQYTVAMVENDLHGQLKVGHVTESGFALGTNAVPNVDNVWKERVLQISDKKPHFSLFSLINIGRLALVVAKIAATATVTMPLRSAPVRQLTTIGGWLFTSGFWSL